MEDYESTYFKYMIPEWKNSYIDYSELLKFINKNINKNEIIPSNEKDNIISNQEKEPKHNEIIIIFKSKLNKELKKFYLFFIQQERELYLSINTRLHIKKKYNTFNNIEISKEFDELIKLTKNTCAIAQYVYQNLYCLNKILKEFDIQYYKNFKIKSNISLKYIIENLEKKNSDLLYIYQYKIINEISALVEDLIEDLIYFNNKFEDNNLSKTYINNENSNLQENLIIDDSQKIKVNNNKKITKLKILLKNMELFYQNSNDIFLDWINSQKFEYYKKSIICLKKKNENDLNVSFSSLNISISDENSLNIKISLIQNWFMYTCIYLIFPNIYSTIRFITDIEDVVISENNQLLCVLIIAMTPLGELLSLKFISITITKSFKKLMIFSTIFSFIGNLLFILGVFLKNYILIIFSRLFLGFGLNTTVNRNYLTEFIPKKDIELYLFYFKIVTLLGMASGPFITLIMNINIYNNIEESNNLKKLNFSLPSLICLLFSIFLFILIIIKYKEPNDDNFNIYSEGQKPIEQNIRDSFALDESLTFHEFKHLKEINKRLSEFNNQNKYNDTNLVSVNINNLIENERAKNGNITRAFIFITLYLIITNITIFSFYVITPIFYLNKNSNKTTTVTITSLIFFLTLLTYIPIYCINLSYISNKISSVRYILILSVLLIICYIWSILTLNLSLKSNEKNDDDNFIYLFCPCFLFIIINSYILENEVVAFLIKIIPDNFLIYNFNSYEVAHFVKYISELIGCLEGIFLKLGVADGKVLKYLNIFNLFLTIIIVIWFKFSSYRFIDRPIRRIIYSKNVRLITRTEF